MIPGRNISIYLPGDLHTQLRTAAECLGRTPSWVVQQLLARYSVDMVQWYLEAKRRRANKEAEDTALLERLVGEAEPED